MSKPIDKDEMLRRLDDSHHGRIILVGEYTNLSVKTTFKCTECGRELYMTPSHAIRKSTHNPCSKIGWRNENDILQELDKVHNGNIKLLSHFTKMHDNHWFECNVCGYKWFTTVDSVVRAKHGCRNCKGLTPKTTEDAINILDKYFHGKIQLIGEYNGWKAPSTFHCTNCGGTWEVCGGPYVTGCVQDCPICGRFPPLTAEQYQSILDKNSGGTIKIIGEVINKTTPVLLKCTACGHMWSPSPANIINQYQGCPVCAPQSRGENLIYDLLKGNLGVDGFIYHAKFENLKGVGGRCLSYDFYIPSKNLCIEFQGGQHYTPVGYFGGDSKFLVQQEHDRRKRQYCIDNGITLLEIPYTDYDRIEEILEETLL